jgi:hypothetical protein
MIPSRQPIRLQLTFPTNLAPSGLAPDFGVVATLERGGGAGDPFPLAVFSWKLSSTDQKSGDLVMDRVPDKLLSTVDWPNLSPDGKLRSGAADALVSVRAPAIVLVTVITALLYIFASLSISAPAPGLGARLNPLRLAVDGSGRASLANMQIIFFSVIVLYLVAYVLLRTGTLASLSNDVLLLLGIAGIGSVGGTLATSTTQRLSFDNWAWVKGKHWTRPTGDHVSGPQWSDLFTTAGDFDPYKFQMLSFSSVIGISLLTIGLNGLGDFAIPQSLLGVIGLSQATYIGGKIVTRSTFGDLDKKLTELRKAQADFLTATAAAWQPPTSPGTPGRQDQLAAAITANPERYRAFKVLVDPAYTMFAELFADRDEHPNLEPDP